MQRLTPAGVQIRRATTLSRRGGRRSGRAQRPKRGAFRHGKMSVTGLLVRQLPRRSSPRRSDCRGDWGPGWRRRYAEIDHKACVRRAALLAQRSRRHRPARHLHFRCGRKPGYPALGAGRLVSLLSIRQRSRWFAQYSGSRLGLYEHRIRDNIIEGDIERPVGGILSQLQPTNRGRAQVLGAA
jgi:hypothetical protein